MKLDKIREGATVDEVLEEVVTARRAGTDPKELFGGPRDWLDSAIPPIAFVIGNAVAGLTPAIWAAVAAELVVVAIRLARRETLRHAFSGAFGVVIAVVIARATGEAKNFFLPGIVVNAVYAVAFLISVAVRKPVVGLIMKVVTERPAEWHNHPLVRRAYAEATVGWAMTFALRVVVMETLRRTDHTNWLSFAKIAMGWPLYVLALAATMPYVKWRAQSVAHLAEPAEPAAEAGGEDAEENAP